jgi:hypothetical protein
MVGDKSVLGLATQEQRDIDSSQVQVPTQSWSAVDSTLFDLATGRKSRCPVRMTNFPIELFLRGEGGVASREARFVALAMKSIFNVLKEEWWHFDYQAWPEHDSNISKIKQ